ncbi:MAG: hypothetical protein ABUL72_05470 [Armatimonadota bacterium]
MGLAIAVAVIGKGRAKTLYDRMGAGFAAFIVLQIPVFFLTACGPSLIIEVATIPAAVLAGIAYGKRWDAVRIFFIAAMSLVQMIYGPLIRK